MQKWICLNFIIYYVCARKILLQTPATSSSLWNITWSKLIIPHGGLPNTSAETLMASTVVSCCEFCFGSAALYCCGVGSCFDALPETLLPALRYVSAPVLTENWRPRQRVFSRFLCFKLSQLWQCWNDSDSHPAPLLVWQRCRGTGMWTFAFLSWFSSEPTENSRLLIFGRCLLILSSKCSCAKFSPNFLSNTIVWSFLHVSEAFPLARSEPDDSLQVWVFPCARHAQSIFELEPHEIALSGWHQAGSQTQEAELSWGYSSYTLRATFR